MTRAFLAALDDDQRHAGGEQGLQLRGGRAVGSQVFHGQGALFMSGAL